MLVPRWWTNSCIVSKYFRWIVIFSFPHSLGMKKTHLLTRYTNIDIWKLFHPRSCFIDYICTYDFTGYENIQMNNLTYLSTKDFPLKPKNKHNAINLEQWEIQIQTETPERECSTIHREMKKLNLNVFSYTFIWPTSMLEIIKNNIRSHWPNTIFE